MRDGLRNTTRTDGANRTLCSWDATIRAAIWMTAEQGCCEVRFGSLARMLSQNYTRMGGAPRPPHRAKQRNTMRTQGGGTTETDTRNESARNERKDMLHFSICACHPCAGSMLIFSVSFAPLLLHKKVFLCDEVSFQPYVDGENLTIRTVFWKTPKQGLLHVAPLFVRTRAVTNLHTDGRYPHPLTRQAACECCAKRGAGGGCARLRGRTRSGRKNPNVYWAIYACRLRGLRR